MASRFGQFADPSAPPADLFNIWRDDYMLSPQQAAAEAAERAQNTLFDGVLPPFSNVGNTGRDLGVKIVIFISSIPSSLELFSGRQILIVRLDGSC